MNASTLVGRLERVEIRVGTVVRAEEFPDARKPAYKLWIDLCDIRNQDVQRATHPSLPNRGAGGSASSLRHEHPAQAGRQVRLGGSHDWLRRRRWKCNTRTARKTGPCGTRLA